MARGRIRGARRERRCGVAPGKGGPRGRAGQLGARRRPQRQAAHLLSVDEVEDLPELVDLFLREGHGHPAIEDLRSTSAPRRRRALLRSGRERGVAGASPRTVGAPGATRAVQVSMYKEPLAPTPTHPCMGEPFPPPGWSRRRGSSSGRGARAPGRQGSAGDVPTGRRRRPSTFPTLSGAARRGAALGGGEWAGESGRATPEQRFFSIGTPPPMTLTARVAAHGPPNTPQLRAK